jgi:hypothetical protein
LKKNQSVNEGTAINIISMVAIVSIVGIVAIFLILDSRSPAMLTSIGSSDTAFLEDSLTGHVISDNPASCTESDSGNDPGKYGEVQYGTAKGWDRCTGLDNKCSGENCYLIETYCNSANSNENSQPILTEKIPCEDCSQGVCTDMPHTITNDSNSNTDQEESVCTDSDGGKNADVKGTVNLGSGKHSDYCISKYNILNLFSISVPVDSCTGNDCVLKEYFCTSDKIESQEMECAYGCSNGVCTSHIEQNNSECKITKAYWEAPHDSITGNALAIPASEQNAITGNVVDSCASELGPCDASSKTNCEKTCGGKTYYCIDLDGSQWVTAQPACSNTVNSCRHAKFCGDDLLCYPPHGSWRYQFEIPSETGALCKNAVDDDCDGLADCADPACASECIGTGAKCPADLGTCDYSTVCDESGGKKTVDGKPFCPGWYCRAMQYNSMLIYNWVNSSSVAQCGISMCGSMAKCDGKQFYCTQRYVEGDSFASSWGYYSVLDLNLQTDRYNCGSFCNRCVDNYNCVNGKCDSDEPGTQECIDDIKAAYTCKPTPFGTLTNFYYDQSGTFVCNGQYVYCADIGYGSRVISAGEIEASCTGPSDACKDMTYFVKSGYSLPDQGSVMRTCYAMGDSQGYGWVDDKMVVCNDGSQVRKTVGCAASGKTEVSCSLSKVCVDKLGVCGPATSSCYSQCDGTEYLCGNIKGEWKWRTRQQTDDYCKDFLNSYPYYWYQDSTGSHQNQSCTNITFPGTCGKPIETCQASLGRMIPSTQEVCADLTIVSKGACASMDLVSGFCFDSEFALDQVKTIPPMGKPVVEGLFRWGVDSRGMAVMLPMDSNKGIAEDIIKIKFITGNGKPYPQNITLSGRSYPVYIKMSIKRGDGVICTSAQFPSNGCMMGEYPLSADGTIMLPIQGIPGNGEEHYSMGKLTGNLNPEYVKDAKIPGNLTLLSVAPAYQNEYNQIVGNNLEYPQNIFLANVLPPSHIDAVTPNTVGPNSIITLTGGPFDYHEVRSILPGYTYSIVIDYGSNSSIKPDPSYLYYCNSTKLQVKIPPELTGEHTIRVANGYGYSNAVTISVVSGITQSGQVNPECKKVQMYPSSISKVSPLNGTPGTPVDITLFYVYPSVNKPTSIFYSQKNATMTLTTTQSSSYFSYATYRTIVPEGASTGNIKIQPQGQDVMVGPVFTINGGSHDNRTEINTTPIGQLMNLVVESTGCDNKEQKVYFRVKDTATGQYVATMTNTNLTLSSSPKKYQWRVVSPKTYIFQAVRIMNNQEAQFVDSSNRLACAGSGQDMVCFTDE